MVLTAVVEKLFQFHTHTPIPDASIFPSVYTVCVSLLCFLLPEPPEVYVFANNARSKTNVVLNCMATGFYPPEIDIHIKRNSRILTEDDGVMSTGSRPNEDYTYQRRDSVVILRTDVAMYSCYVVHHSTGFEITKVWGEKFV
uniref:Ig-like domain-containing protein n=1 Tax=Sphaeramia orbicularis TaxID=375764 RepID=A0A672YSN7_9TELE